MRMRSMGHVAYVGDIRNECEFFVGNPERWTSPERPRRRWENNIKMDLREI
jgi:hypothetical protein